MSSSYESKTLQQANRKIKVSGGSEEHNDGVSYDILSGWRHAKIMLTHERLVVWILGLVLFTCEVLLDYYTGLSKLEKMQQAKGDPVAAMLLTFVKVITYGHPVSVAITCSILRAACVEGLKGTGLDRVQKSFKSFQEIPAAPENSRITAPRGKPERIRNEHLVRGCLLDRPAILLVMSFIGVQGLLRSLAVTLGGDKYDIQSYLIAYMFWVFVMIPRAAKRWCPAHYKRYTTLLQRGLLIGIPMAIGPAILVPAMLQVWTPDELVLYYPVVLSFLEFISISFILNNSVVQYHSAEATSILARQAVAMFDANRLGVLLVVANTTGTRAGLFRAVIWSAILDSLSRNNLYITTFRAVRYVFKRCVRAVRCSGADPVPIPDFQKIGLFKRIFLGCKLDTEYVVIWVLILMRVLDHGITTSAFDETTGKMHDALRCSWEVIAMVILGEVLGDLLTMILNRVMRVVVPWLAVVTPALQPSHDVLIHVVMWAAIAMLYAAGVGSAGVLVEELRKNNE